jgi:hypothetical protein
MAKNLVWVADSNFDRLQARSGLTLKNQSQMSKLPDIREPAPVKDRAEYIASLTEFRDRYELATHRLFEMKGVDAARQIKRLTLALQFLENERRNKVPYGTGKAVRAAINECVSLREAAYLGELTDDLIDLSAAQALIGTINSLISKSQVKDEDEAVEDAVFDPRLGALLENASAQTALPKLEGKPYVVAKVPLIPVATMSHTKLQNRGFAATNAGGYLIIADQIVLGVAPKSGIEQADEFRRALRRETRQKLVFVDQRPAGHKGVLWYWMMRESDLQSFLAAFPNNALKLQSWGLAI